MTSHISVLGE